MKRLLAFAASLAALLAAYSLLATAAVPFVPSNTWLAVGSLGTVRAGASATLLPDGRVLIAGGMGDSGATATAERFSPEGGAFLGAPAMQAARANHTATLLRDGRVLVVGGTGADGTALSGAELYDAGSNVWLPAGSLNTARRGQTATLLADGRVLVAGGDSGGNAVDSIEIFDPASRQFTTAGALSSPRTQHAAARLADGRVVIAGGNNSTSALSTTDIFNPSTGAVSSGPVMLAARSGLTATTLLDGRVLIAGGSDGTSELASAELLDAAATSFGATGTAMKSARQNHLALLLPHNNQVLIVGGLAGGQPLRSAEYFTPWQGATGAFCAQAVCGSGYAGPALPSAARAWAAGVALSVPADAVTRSGAADGLALVAGGTGEASADLFGFATIRTDKEDYAPGETVTITGGGWKPDEWVTLVLQESPNLDTHPLKMVQADDNGKIISTEFQPDEHDIGIQFYLNAYGEQSQAQATFRDSVDSVTITAPTSASPVTITTLPASVAINFTYVTSATGTTTAEIDILGTTLSATKDVTPGTHSDSISITIPAGTPNGSFNIKTTVSNNTGGGANQKNDNQNAAVIINVPSNTAPQAGTKTVTLNEDTPTAITLTGSDTGTCELTFSIVSGPTKGTLGGVTNIVCVPGSPNTDSASVTYTPNANTSGADSFTYKVNDGSLDSPSAQVSITVTAVNDPPVGTSSSISVAEDGIYAFAAADFGFTDPNDTPPNQLLNVIITSAPSGLTLAGSPVTSGTSVPGSGLAGDLKFTPAANVNGAGVASIGFKVQDNGGTANGGVDTDTTSRTLTVNVTPVNDTPVANAAEFTTNEDTSSNFSLTTAASDLETASASLTYNIVTPPSGGTLTPNGGGSFTYAPPADFSGDKTFTFSVTDRGDPDNCTPVGTFCAAAKTSTTATVTIHVTAVNDAPSFTKGADESVLEDTGAHTVTNWATTISKGPADESAQTVEFTVTNDNPSLFSVVPVISPDGTLNYVLAADRFGVANLAVTLKDNGGIANGGVDTSAPQTFKITVFGVNDRPSFVAGMNVTVNEDSGAHTAGWATAITAGPYEDDSQSVHFEVTNDNNPLFSTQPAISPGGGLTFTPAADAFGITTVTVTLKDNGGTANGGLDASESKTFTITINAVNDAPSFTPGANVTVLEDAVPYSAAWASAISPGPNEAGQVVNFVVSNNNNALFLVQPAISQTGALSFTLNPNAFGPATVSVTLHDDGGTANGGVDTSAGQTFTITVTGVNDAPSFVPGMNVAVNEDSGAYSAGWATSVTAGPGEDGTQTVHFEVSNSNNALFSTQPGVSATGTLTFTTAADAFGSATVTVALYDSGGTDNGGIDHSGTVTFTITVTEVNDAPSFTKGADQTVFEDAGLQTAANWATAITAGPPNESGQAVNFTVTTNNNALFSSLPAVSPNGTLTYTPAANAFGTATVYVTAKDNGGTANGGVDTSAPQTFTITVTAVNDAPSFTAGTNVTVLEDAPAYSAAWASAISPGPNETGQAVNFVVSNHNNALFSAQPAISPNGVLTFTVAANAFGQASVDVTLNDNGGTANGGVDHSATVTFTITVTSVNDAPAVSKSGDTTAQYSDPTAPAVTITATDIDSPGNVLTATGQYKLASDPSFSPGMPPGLTLSVPASNGTSIPGGATFAIGGTANVAAGVYIVRITVTDHEAVNAFSYTDVGLTVTKETTALDYTGNSGMIFTGGPAVDTATVQLAAHLTQANDSYPGNLALAKVRFEMYKAGNMGATPDIVVGNVPVNASGDAIATTSAGVDQWTIKVKVEDSNGYWTSPVDMTLLCIDYGSTTQRTTGGGWIPDASSRNGKDNFGFTVNYQKNGSPKGNSTFMIRGMDGFNYLVKGTSWSGGGLTFYADPSLGSFSGKAVVQKIDANGVVVDSWGNYSYVVNIIDGDLRTPKVTDSYGITILDNGGNVWRQLGPAPSGVLTMGGGNVSVFSK